MWTGLSGCLSVYDASDYSNTCLIKLYSGMEIGHTQVDKVKTTAITSEIRGLGNYKEQSINLRVNGLNLEGLACIIHYLELSIILAECGISGLFLGYRSPLIINN